MQLLVAVGTCNHRVQADMSDVDGKGGAPALEGVLLETPPGVDSVRPDECQDGTDSGNTETRSHISKPVEAPLVGDGISTLPASKPFTEVAGTTLGEVRQRLHEYIAKEPTRTVDLDVEQQLANFEKSSAGHAHLKNLFHDLSFHFTKIAWIHEKLFLYLKERGVSEPDHEVAATLRNAGAYFGEVMPSVNTHKENLKITANDMTTIVNQVGPDMELSLKRRTRARVSYDAAASKLEALLQKKADPAKIEQARERVEETKPVYEQLNSDIKEKMDMLFEYRQRKLTQVFEDIVDGTKAFGAALADIEISRK